MARPMVLMQEDLLSELWRKHMDGVPVLALIRRNNIEDIITSPTLTKLLGYMSAMEDSQDSIVQDIIYASLFPEWLTEKAEELTVVTSPKDWYYKGKMPLGHWVKR